MEMGSGVSSGRLTTNRDGGKVITHEYQNLAVLLVDGDHSALGGAFLAGLLDADVGDVGKVAQQLQLLRTKSTSASERSCGWTERRRATE